MLQTTGTWEERLPSKAHNKVFERSIYNNFTVDFVLLELIAALAKLLACVR